MLGCDGIFDKLSDQQVMRAVWESVRKRYKQQDTSLHLLSGAAVETVLKLSVEQKTADNITVVIVMFKNLKKTLKRELNLLEQIKDTDDDVLAEDQSSTSKVLNLPNYDVTLDLVSLMPKHIDLARLQGRENEVVIAKFMPPPKPLEPILSPKSQSRDYNNISAPPRFGNTLDVQNMIASMRNKTPLHSL